MAKAKAEQLFNLGIEDALLLGDCPGFGYEDYGRWPGAAACYDDKEGWPLGLMFDADVGFHFYLMRIADMVGLWRTAQTETRFTISS